MRASGSLQNIEHIVLFMQQNHSFDNYFGTRYGVNGFGDTPLNPPPVFQQRGWAPSPTGGGPTDFNNPKQYTLPFRLDTQRGPSISGQCINDPDPIGSACVPRGTSVPTTTGCPTRSGAHRETALLLRRDPALSRRLRRCSVSNSTTSSAQSRLNLALFPCSRWQANASSRTSRKA
jgi:Phosphoesterase family